MKNNKSIGLPNGPNEFLKDITQHISVEGYKRYSEDVNNPYNIIESNNITMEDVDFPVMGTDNLGNEQIMMPGNNYQFPGDSVLEVPMAQKGEETKIYNKPIEQEEGIAASIAASIDNFVTPILRNFTGRAGTNDNISLRVPPGEMKFFRNNEQPVNSNYIIGGDYMEDAPTAYKASEYPNTMYTTRGQTQEIDFETQQFYGVVDGNIKLGKKTDFRDDDVIVPLRPNFGGNFTLQKKEPLDPEFIKEAKEFNKVTNQIRESAYLFPEQKVWEEMVTVKKKGSRKTGPGVYEFNPEYKDIINKLKDKFGKGSYMYDLEPILKNYNSNGYDILNTAGNQLDTFGNKVILFDPESNEHLFISQLGEQKRNEKIIAFKEKYPNANYLNLDNGRFSKYMVNKEGINSDNATEYMQNSFKGPDATGYNFAYKEGGSLPKAQVGTEIMNLRDYVVTDAEKAYLNDNKDQFCFKGKCLESTRKAFNSTAGTIPDVDDSYKTWESMGATSAKGSPTPKMIEESPWFAGDTGDSAVDSWDVQGKIVDSGGVTVYNRNDPNSNYTAGKAAIGSIYSFGPSGRKDSSYKARNQGYSKKFNLQPSHHSAQVTGFDEKSNENILYDSYIGKYMTESELINYWKDSHINYELEAVGTPSNYKNLTREKLKNDPNFYNKITTSPYNVNVNTLKNATKDAEVQIKEDGKYRSPGFDQDAMGNFSNSLSKNKEILMQELNLNDENYNELANLSLALAMAESEGGSALSFLEPLGDTQGLTQLNWDNIKKDEQLFKKMKNINLKLGKKSIQSLADLRDPAKSAIATMVYLSKGQGEQERMFKTGLNPSVRDFYDNTGLIDNLRSSSAKINKNGIYLDELNERIPWDDLSKSNAITEMVGKIGSPGSFILDEMRQYFDPGVKKSDFAIMDPEEITEYLNNITKEKQLETRAIADRYKAKLADDGRLVISMKTNGNKEDMSFPKRMGYYWQSPAALMTGDAEGKNVHASRIEHYYNSLSSPEVLAQKKEAQITETPERGFKIGGELENNTVYKNYVNGDYTGSEMESKAEKVYDKLNRLHYKNSKKLGMTPANYILTHVVG